MKSFHQRSNYVYIGLYTIFNIYFPSSAQRKRPHAIPQTAECTDSTGLPQTPAGRARLKTRPLDAPDAPGLTRLLFLLFQVKLVNIRNDDIADGNPKLILGLIWTIILHFQVSSSVSVAVHYLRHLHIASPPICQLLFPASLGPIKAVDRSCCQI